MDLLDSAEVKPSAGVTGDLVDTAQIKKPVAQSLPARSSPAQQSGDLVDAAKVRSTDDDSRMGEGEAWYSKPLTTSLLGIPEYREGAGPIERGAEKFG
jgi:hypothetical protein